MASKRPRMAERDDVNRIGSVRYPRVAYKSRWCRLMGGVPGAEVHKRGIKSNRLVITFEEGGIVISHVEERPP